MEPLQDFSSQNIPKARPEIEDNTAYSAPLEGRRDFLRLDFNENTIGPSPLVIEAIHKVSSKQISIYPEYNGLKEAIANNLNRSELTRFLNPNQIGIFNGVDAAIHSIFSTYGAVSYTHLRAHET